MGNFPGAAPPALGSTLLRIEEKQESLRPPPLSCGNRDIDVEALDGGFRYGEITSVAGASGTGKTTLAFQAIASHLITHERGDVALIATTDPPLARLRDVLISRVTHDGHGSAFEESGFVYRKQPSVICPSQSILDRISPLLDRVHISRVFDFPGVAEAISEVTANIEKISQEFNNANEEEKDERAHGIADSEDEDETIEFLPENSTREPGAAPAPFQDRQARPAAMVVIDNIANVVGPMMTKSQVQGHALLANVMRSLHQMTCRHHCCTLILNTAVGLRPQETRYHRRPEDQVSVFASIPGKPALGKHFSFLVDTSIFLSTAPRSKDDADVAYSDIREGRRFKEVGVIEVRTDRNGCREGKWGAFTIEDGTNIRSVRF